MLGKSVIVLAVVFCSVNSLDTSQVNVDRRCVLTESQVCPNWTLNTSWPNCAGQERSEEAEASLQNLRLFLKSSCHADISQFICMSYYTPCNPITSEPIVPCRSFCEEVRDSCQCVLEAGGLSWPRDLNCSKYEADTSKCYQPESVHKDECCDRKFKAVGSTSYRSPTYEIVNASSLKQKYSESEVSFPAQGTFNCCTTVDIVEMTGEWKGNDDYIYRESTYTLRKTVSYEQLEHVGCFIEMTTETKYKYKEKRYCTSPQYRIKGAATNSMCAGDMEMYARVRIVAAHSEGCRVYFDALVLHRYKPNPLQGGGHGNQTVKIVSDEHPLCNPGIVGLLKPRQEYFIGGYYASDSFGQTQIYILPLNAPIKKWSNIKKWTDKVKSCLVNVH